MLDKKWFVYLVLCMDGSVYTGVTNDIEKRMNAHKSGRGSKYVKSKGFLNLIAQKECANKVEACKSEYYIKQLSKIEKLEWFRN